MPNRNTALVVIDVQNEMVEWAHRKDDLLRNTGDLLQKARASGASVVFMQHDDEEYEPMKPGEPGWEIYRSMVVREGEPVIRKRYADSFYETSLDNELRSRNVEHLVICGMNTDHCIDATSRGAVERGYEVTLAGDAHTTVNDEARKMTGQGYISAEQVISHHNYLLGGLHHTRSDRRISVRETAEIEFP